VGSTAKLDRAFVFTARNQRTYPITVLVEDQVPVVRDNRLQLEFLNQESWDHDPERGTMRTSISLQPQEQVERKFRYELRYPENVHVYGVD
jgi:Domain of unknown function (DUF4139)